MPYFVNILQQKVFQLNANKQNASRKKKEALEKIDPALSSSKIVNGSLVKTDKGYLFISIALGKATINDKPVTALSPQSPLGKKLLGLSVGDVAEINNNKYMIETIE